ncbi:GxxExxY protein [bacterium]|nr:GxxExxY protein [bacterium]
MKQYDAPNADLTQRIIGCAYHVSNTLGSGFLEKVYENALMIALEKANLKAEQQKPIDVYYEDFLVGQFAADILVEDGVILELKCVSELANIHTAQCLNYLKATGLKTCLLLNFNKAKVEVKRVSL